MGTHGEPREYKMREGFSPSSFNENYNSSGPKRLVMGKGSLTLNNLSNSQNSQEGHIGTSKEKVKPCELQGKQHSGQMELKVLASKFLEAFKVWETDVGEAAISPVRKDN